MYECMIPLSLVSQRSSGHRLWRLLSMNEFASLLKFPSFLINNMCLNCVFVLKSTHNTLEFWQLDYWKDTIFMHFCCILFLHQQQMDYLVNTEYEFFDDLMVTNIDSKYMLTSSIVQRNGPVSSVFKHMSLPFTTSKSLLQHPRLSWCSIWFTWMIHVVHDTPQIVTM